MIVALNSAARCIAALLPSGRARIETGGRSMMRACRSGVGARPSGRARIFKTAFAAVKRSAERWWRPAFGSGED